MSQIYDFVLLESHGRELLALSTLLAPPRRRIYNTHKEQQQQQQERVARRDVFIYIIISIIYIYSHIDNQQSER